MILKVTASIVSTPHAVRRVARHDNQSVVQCLLPADPPFQQAAQHL